MILLDFFCHGRNSMANKFSVKCTNKKGGRFCRSKGQYRVISEILLFLVGILITSYIIINFGNVENTIKKISLRDQMESVSDIVATAIAKVASADNATIRLSIPYLISSNQYKIELKDTDGGKLVVRTSDGNASIERQIFNIDYDNTNSNNHVINNSEVASSAGFVQVVKNEKITIMRWGKS